MKFWLFACALTLACFVHAAPETPTTPNSTTTSDAPFGSLLPEAGSPKTEMMEVEVIKTQDLKSSIQQLPQLVERLKIESAAADNPHVLVPYRPNYVLPFTWQSNPNDQEINQLTADLADDPNASHGDYRHFESVFQISLKYQLATGVLGKHSRLEAAYTNRSFWQSYSSKISRPFRETNHEPELILTWPTQNKYVDYLSVALNHQSNGQTGNLSRSWNRVIVGAGAIYPFGVLQTKLWWRVPESEKATKDSPSGDDNPDITRYLGYGEVRFIYAYGHNNVTFTTRNNMRLNGNRGSIEVNYSFPINSRVKGYVLYFNGYGDSLIDYNYHQQRFGVGVLLSDWF